MAESRGVEERMVKHFKWNDIKVERLNSLLDRQFLTGTNLMLVRLQLKKGAKVPRHSHLHEQVAYVLEGSLEFVIGDKSTIVRSGEVMCIPPNVPHEVLALEDTINLDIFHPPRQDWIDGNDAYLRQETGPKA